MSFGSQRDAGEDAIEERFRGSHSVSQGLTKSAQEFHRTPQFAPGEIQLRSFAGDAAELRERRIARLRLLWERRRTLTKFSICGAVLAIAAALLLPVEFASTTRLMPPDQSSGTGMAMLAALAGKVAGSLGALGGDLLGLKTSSDLFVGVLSSRIVQDELVNKFELRKLYGVRRLQDARKELTRRTDISIDRKSGIITIQVTDHDPERATAMAQEYVSQLNRVVNQLNTSSAYRERIFLEDRLQQVKMDLESAEKDFSQFASRNTAIDIKEQGKAMVEAAAALEGQLIASETELQGLRQIYADGNVRIRAAQSRVEELKRQLRKLGGSSDTEQDTNLASLKDAEIYPSIRKLPLLGVAYADLYRRTKVEEVVFETLTQEYELAKVQEAKEVPSIKVLDPAEVPEKKVFPPRTLIVLLGICIAFCVGAVYVLGIARWEEIDPQDPGKVLALDVYRTVKPRFATVATLLAGVKKILGRFRNSNNVAPARTE